MIPASQRFDAFYFAGRERKDRLIVDIDLVFLDRFAKVGFKKKDLLGRGVHVLVEDRMLRSPDRFA